MISIIICTKDREEDLKRCIESINTQTYRGKKEIIIVDGGNLDRKSLQNRNSVKVVKQTSRGLVKARKLGLEKSHGDIIFFFDDDVILENDYIENIMKNFDDDKIGGQTGYIVNRPRGLKQALKTLLLTPFFLDSFKNGTLIGSGKASDIKTDRKMYVAWLSGCNMSYRRGILNKIGFDDFFDTVWQGEDVDLSYRAGRKSFLLFEPSAKLIHTESGKNRIKGGKWMYNLVCSINYMFKKHIEKTLSNKIKRAMAFAGLLTISVFYAPINPRISKAYLEGFSRAMKFSG